MDIFYVVSMTEDENGGIVRYQITQDKNIEKIDFTPLKRANYLAVSVDKKYLYSTCKVGDSGGVASFLIGENGKLEKISEFTAKGESTCHVTLDNSEKFLFATNYMSSSIAVFKLENGIIKEICEFVKHIGKSVNAIRQECAHPHFNTITPDGKFLTVIDLGIDKIVSYKLCKDKGIDKNNPIISDINPLGSGPRHLVFNKQGNIAYLLNELGNSVMVTEYCNGKYTIKQTITTLPDNVNTQTKASAIRLSEDEKFLFASNRGYDSIISYKINDDNKLSFNQIISSAGESPRDFNFLNDQSLMLIANEFTDNMLLCNYNIETGMLEAQKEYSQIHPLCILPIKLK